MAKLSVINRNEKRRETVKKFAEKRKALQDVANNQALSSEERYEARLKLQKLPRNASPVRVRNRCAQIGRAHV